MGMPLVVRPPIAPMLAQLARELPVGDYLYEPKWDGFRCLAFRDGDQIDLRSRHDRPLARYFPEIVDGLRVAVPDGTVLDGEIVLVGQRGFDFAALMSRLHPAATRVARLSAEWPASYVAFDVLATGPDDLREHPFAERRATLESLLAAGSETIRITPATADVAEAQGWLERFAGGGVDGVVAKGCALRYQPNRRAMTKVKRERTVDCVVAGARVTLKDPPGVSSLSLGLYADRGELRHVGVASAFTTDQRRQFLDDLRGLVVPLDEHPWRHGFGIERSPIGRLKGSAGRWTPEMEHDWVPLAPVRVCEVAVDSIDTDRFRHPARFRRWRPDRDPRSCGMDQLVIEPAPVRELLGLPA
jgi:ATP-dependent DNA ligase